MGDIAALSRRASMSWQDWVGLFNPDSLSMALQTSQPNVPEQVDATFAGFASGLYLRNSIVFTCLALRARLFSEARFTWQQMRNNQPGRLFGTADLAVLDKPQPGWSTKDLLRKAILDADLAGAAFLNRDGARIYRLRPDWMTIAYGSKRRPELGSWAPDAEIIGFGHHPGGIASGEPVIPFLPEQIAFFAPHTNPMTGAGVSLLVAALREIQADSASTTHKLSFYEHAATPQLALRFPPTWSKETAEQWIDLFEQEHHGAANAWRTIYLGNGIEALPVGLNFQQMDYKAVQGHAETRIAALTGMHAVVAGFSEGMQGSSLNEGNYNAAKRNVGDTVLWPLWGDIASSIETIVTPLPASRLWVDDRHIPFLREDVKDQATIMQTNMATIASGITAGFDPATVVDFVLANDLSRLKHSGLVSVQLQAPGSQLPAGQQTAAYRVRQDFWATDEPYRSLGTVRSGTVLDAGHPLVAEFPSLVEPVSEPLSERVRRLHTSGVPVPAIASQIDRTERHVRRLLAPAT